MLNITLFSNLFYESGYLAEHDSRQFSTALNINVVGVVTSQLRYSVTQDRWKKP